MFQSGNDEGPGASDMIVGDEAAANRWKKSPLFGGEAVREGIGDVRPSVLAHPVYLGLGQDAVDEAYRTYINIISPSTRNSRKATTNPVHFVGKRKPEIYGAMES